MRKKTKMKISKSGSATGERNVHHCRRSVSESAGGYRKLARRRKRYRKLSRHHRKKAWRQRRELRKLTAAKAMKRGVSWRGES